MQNCFLFLFDVMFLRHLVQVFCLFFFFSIFKDDEMKLRFLSQSEKRKINLVLVT